jgi:hypothetical protein
MIILIILRASLQRVYGTVRYGTVRYSTVRYSKVRVVTSGKYNNFIIIG